MCALLKAQLYKQTSVLPLKVIATSFSKFLSKTQSGTFRAHEMKVILKKSKEHTHLPPHNPKSSFKPKKGTLKTK
jgi:hypothetical protein